jgi:hypothetical protein
MPFATTGSIFDRQSNRIQEVLNKSLRVFLAGLDPVWRENVVTSQGVGNSGDLGRDLKITKLFMGSLTGVIEAGAGFGDKDLYGDLTSTLGPLMHTQAANQAYPSPFEGPNATAYRLAIPMRSLVTNLMITLGEKQADATPALIDQVIAPKLTAFARNMAHTLCNYWYLSQNDTYKLCTVTNASVTNQVNNVPGTHRITFEPSNFACHRFSRGMRVDLIWNSGAASAAVTGMRVNDSNSQLVSTTLTLSNSTRATRIQLVVENVDPLTNQVSLILQSGTSSTAISVLRNDSTTAGTLDAITDLNNNCDVVYANSHLVDNQGGTDYRGIAGINSWLKSGYESGNLKRLLGNEADSTDFIDVSERPEFKSFKYAVNGVLTEYNLKRYLQRVHSAFEPNGHTIDTLIASEGVWAAYESQKIGQYRIDRTSRVASITNEGQAEGFTFTFEGKTYKGSTSRFVEGGTMYGIKLGGKNWKKYVPPSPKGLSKMSEADAYVPFEFVAGAITGTSTNQLPVYQTGSTGGPNLVTQASQMPGRIRMQLVPDQVNGMKLTGITEDRVYMSSNLSSFG